MFLTINLLFISMNIFLSEVVWNIVPFATESEFGQCLGQPGKLYSACWASVFQKLPSRQLQGGKHASYSWSVVFSEKRSYFVTLEYSCLKWWLCCASPSLSLGNPLAFASGLHVWQVEPCWDTSGFNLLSLFHSKDSNFFHALISGFATFEELLYFSRLHLIPRPVPDTFFRLPGHLKGFILLLNAGMWVLRLLCFDLSEII